MEDQTLGLKNQDPKNIPLGAFACKSKLSLGGQSEPSALFSTRN